jgi:hypothetical protein
VDPKPPNRLATTAYLVVTALLVAFLAAGVVLITTATVGAVRGGHTISDARPGQLFLRLAIDLLPGLLVVAALWQLWGLLRSARRGDPFTIANVWRLRQFGWLLLLGWPLVAYLTMALKEWLASSLPANETGGLFAPPIGGALVFGLAVLALAEVFAHGLRLREDVEGTV